MFQKTSQDEYDFVKEHLSPPLSSRGQSDSDISEFEEAMIGPGMIVKNIMVRKCLITGQLILIIECITMLITLPRGFEKCPFGFLLSFIHIMYFHIHGIRSRVEQGAL